jgi:hypothetical protein
MRDKNRIKPFLEELGKIWEEECPDWRFGQLMFNIFSATGDPFYFEEEKMLEVIKQYFRGNKKF